MTIGAKILAALLSIALISAFSSCEKDGGRDSDEPVPQVTGVGAEKIVPRTMRTYVELNGSVVARNSVQVFPNIAGKIVGSKVRLGQAVRKGDGLVLIDPSSPGAQYAVNVVVSPISGSVVSIPPKNGMKVSTETALLTIGDLSELEIKAYITEKYFSSLKAGQKAEVRVAASPNEVFWATVQSVSPVVDESSRTVETILKIGRNGGRITAGMFSKIKLYLSEHENAISVKESAVAERDGKRVVFTVGPDGTARIREIKEGISVDGRIQILSGVSEGELVITEGVSSVQDGMEVTVISE